MILFCLTYICIFLAKNMINADKPKTDRRDIVLIGSTVLTVYFPRCIIWVIKFNSAKYIVVLVVVDQE